MRSIRCKGTTTGIDSDYLSFGNYLMLGMIAENSASEVPYISVIKYLSVTKENSYMPRGISFWVQDQFFLTT